MPLHGRAITAGDDPMGARDVVVLSHGIWVRRFGSNPAVIGQPVMLDGVPHEVIGVMPAGFQYPLQSEIWIPLRFSARDLETQRGAHYIDVIGRLKPERADRAGSRGHARTRRQDGGGVSAHQSRLLGIGPSVARGDGQQRSPVDVRAAGRGRARAADRVREHRRPGVDQGARPRPRAGGSRRARRRTHHAGALAVDREPRARSGRRRVAAWCSRIGPPARSRHSIRRSACRC